MVKDLEMFSNAELEFNPTDMSNCGQIFPHDFVETNSPYITVGTDYKESK